MLGSIFFYLGVVVGIIVGMEGKWRHQQQEKEER